MLYFVISIVTTFDFPRRAPLGRKMEESASRHVKVFFDFARQRAEKLILNAHRARIQRFSVSNLIFQKLNSTFLL